MSGALTKYLKDFSQFVPPEVPAPAFEVELPVASFESDWLSEPEVTVDLEEEKRKAFAEGEEAGKQQAMAENEAAMEAMRSRHEEEIAAMQTRYEDEIANHLATSVISMKQTIAANIEQACLRLFLTVMERELAADTASELSRQIITEIEGGFAGAIKVTGPERLLSRMREELGSVDHHIDYDVSNDIDVKVQLDGSILMTRLSEFFQSVRGLADE